MAAGGAGKHGELDAAQTGAGQPEGVPGHTPGESAYTHTCHFIHVRTLINIHPLTSHTHWCLTQTSLVPKKTDKCRIVKLTLLQLVYFQREMYMSAGTRTHGWKTYLHAYIWMSPRACTASLVRTFIDIMLSFPKLNLKQVLTLQLPFKVSQKARMSSQGDIVLSYFSSEAVLACCFCANRLMSLSL